MYRRECWLVLAHLICQRYNLPIASRKRHRVALYKVDHGGPVYYQFEAWADAKDLSHAVFTRLGGTSHAPWASLNVGGTVGDDPQAVQDNIQRMYDALEL